MSLRDGITANVQIDGTNRDVINDKPIPGATIEVQLCGYGSQVPRVPNGFNFANLNSTTVVASDTGQFHFTLYSNDLIEPQGTYYTFTYKNENGDILQVEAHLFIGGGEYDTSNLPAYDPSGPPPQLPPLVIGQLLIIDAAADMVFPGDVYTAFKTTLVGNVDFPTFENMIPGNLYTFIIVQDAIGAWAFVWPDNAHNATYVNQDPYGMTIQTFVCDEDGSLYAVGAGTYYP